MSSRETIGLDRPRLDRRSLILLPLALAACGFAPAYGPGGPAEGLRGTIRAAEPSTKDAFELVKQLETRLGRADAVRYDLAYTITTEAIGVGYTPDSTITRYNLTGSVDWTLTDRTTGQRATGGTVSSFTSYSATGSTVAGLAAEEDARRRLMVILADQIVARLLATSGAWAK
jgi:LPS-assembly lipoprotein